jgi:hypothetical protein
VRRLVFVVILLGAAVGLAQPGSGAVTRAAASANTRSGTWDRAGVGNFDITQNGTAITGAWHWGTGGTLQGTLQPDGSVVGTWSGGSSSVTSGSINWNPLSADGKSFTGTTSYGSETRSWGGACVSGPCTNNGTAAPSPAPTVVVVPPASQWGAAVAGTVGSGGAAMNSSPLLGNATSVTATELGLTPEDYVVLAGLKHSCYASFVLGLLGTRKRVSGYQGGILKSYDQLVGLNIPELLANLEFCLAFVDVLAAAASTASVAHPAAVASQAGCGAADVRFVLRGQGRATKITGFHVGAGQLHVSCATVAGGLALTFSTAASTPLRTLVGPRLQLAVLRGKHDAAGGRLSFSYHKS